MSDYEPFVPRQTSESIAVYPGTFDPITMGHLDIIKRALTLFDRVIVAVADNIAKRPLFDIDERLAMIRACFPASETRVSVERVNGLVVDFAYTRGARAIIRGLRAVSDFDFEFQLALMNRRLERDVETVFLMTGFRWIYISSTIIKEAAKHGGDVNGLVPDHVCERLRQIFMVGEGQANGG